MSAGLLELKFQHIAYLDDVKVKLFRLCVHGVVYPALPTDRNHAELSQKTRLESRCTRGALSNCSLRTSSPSLIPPLRILLPNEIIWTFWCGGVLRAHPKASKNLDRLNIRVRKTVFNSQSYWSPKEYKLVVGEMEVF